MKLLKKLLKKLKEKDNAKIDAATRSLVLRKYERLDEVMPAVYDTDFKKVRPIVEDKFYGNKTNSFLNKFLLYTWIGTNVLSCGSSLADISNHEPKTKDAVGDYETKAYWNDNAARDIEGQMKKFVASDSAFFADSVEPNLEIALESVKKSSQTIKNRISELRNTQEYKAHEDYKDDVQSDMYSQMIWITCIAIGGRFANWGRHRWKNKNLNKQLKEIVPNGNIDDIYYW